MSKELRRFSYLVCKSIAEEMRQLRKDIDSEEISGLVKLSHLGALLSLDSTSKSIVRAVKQIEKEQEANQ